jgi:hypothetical protein
VDPNVRAAFLLKSTPSSLFFSADAESRVQILPFVFLEPPSGCISRAVHPSASIPPS